MIGTFRLPCLVAVVLLAAGCPETKTCPAGMHPLGTTNDCTPDATDAGPTDAGHDAGGDAGPCNGACSGDTPVCDTMTGMCVGCLGATDCAAPTPACDTDTHTCVACVGDGDCTDVAMGKCDVASHTCVACGTSTDCSHFTDTAVCDTTNGTCVQCTADDTSACGGNTCKSDGTCSMYGTTQRACDPCDTDANCGGANDYCVPMQYMGADHGAYCLTDANDAGSCDQPFLSVIDGRPTLSGRTGGRYCGINETVTTCEAVRGLLDDAACPDGTDSECPEGGLCRNLNGVSPNHCTYRCSGAASECLMAPTAGYGCGPGSTGGDSFCGG